jgi:hypothetical protein
VANKLRGETSIKLGEAEYTLCPTFQNIANLEDKVGAIGVLITRVNENQIKVTDIVYLIACMSNNMDKLDEIYQQVIDEGFYNLVTDMMIFLSGLMGKKDSGGEASDSEGE